MTESRSRLYQPFGEDSGLGFGYDSAMDQAQFKSVKHRELTSFRQMGLISLAILNNRNLLPLSIGLIGHQKFTSNHNYYNMFFWKSLSLAALILSFSLVYGDNVIVGSQAAYDLALKPVPMGLYDHINKTFSNGQYIYDVSISENGLFVAVLIFRKIKGGGYDGGYYDKIILIQTDHKQDKVIAEKEYMPQSQLRNPQGDSTVTKLGKLNDSGDKICLEIGTQSSNIAPYNVTHDWQMREIPSGRIIAKHLDKNQALNWEVKK